MCMGFVSRIVVGFSVGYIALEIGIPKWVARTVGRWQAKWLKKARISREGIRFGM